MNKRAVLCFTVSYLRVLTMQSGVDAWKAVYHVNETVCTFSMEEQLSPLSKSSSSSHEIPSNF